MSAVSNHLLKNGSRLIVVPQSGTASLTALLMVKVGSRYETPALMGAAHFIEHMAFKGTARRPDTQIISEELDRYGADYNAYTGKDLTAYYVKIDARHGRAAVDILDDIVFHSVFDASELERERGVILEEINMYRDNPHDHVADILEESIFAGSSLGHNIAGSPQTVSRMKRQNLLAFKQAYYVPKRVTLVLAGQVDGSVMSFAKKNLSGLATSSAGKPYRRYTPERRTPSPALQIKDTEQLQLMLGFHGIPFSHPGRDAISLLGLILGGFMSSRLFIQIRERLGLCYSIGASHTSLEDTGIFTVAAGLDKTRLPEASKAIFEELKKITSAYVTDAELSRAKDHIRGRMALAFEDSASRAEWYGRGWVFNRKLESPEERLKKLDAVTASDIKKIANKILRPGNMVAAAVGPLTSKQHFAKIMAWK